MSAINHFANPECIDLNQRIKKRRFEIYRLFYMYSHGTTLYNWQTLISKLLFKLTRPISEMADITPLVYAIVIR